MESVIDVYLLILVWVGFVLGICVGILIPMMLIRNVGQHCRPLKTEPENHHEENPFEHLYIGAEPCDPRSPEFPVWASRKYDALFGRPMTQLAALEKERSIMGWAFIGLDMLVKPPEGTLPELTFWEATLIYHRIESSLGIKHTSTPSL